MMGEDDGSEDEEMMTFQDGDPHMDHFYIYVCTLYTLEEMDTGELKDLDHEDHEAKKQDRLPQHTEDKSAIKDQR